MKKVKNDIMINYIMRFGALFLLFTEANNYDLSLIYAIIYVDLCYIIVIDNLLHRIV